MKKIVLILIIFAIAFFLGVAFTLNNIQIDGVNELDNRNNNNKIHESIYWLWIRIQRNKKSRSNRNRLFAYLRR